MDTLILIALFVTVLLFRFAPKRVYGLVLFTLCWGAMVALFLYHSTSALNLNF